MTTHEIEKVMAGKLVDVALGENLTVSVFDGAEWVAKRSGDREAILGAMFSTGEDVLRFYRGEQRLGWVHLVYGNGSDVFSDWTHSVEGLLAPVLAFGETL